MPGKQECKSTAHNPEPTEDWSIKKCNQNSRPWASSTCVKNGLPQVKPLHRHQSCQKEYRLRPDIASAHSRLSHLSTQLVFLDNVREQTSPDTEILVSSLLIWAAHIVVEIIKPYSNHKHPGAMMDRKGAMTSQSLEVDSVYMTKHHLSKLIDAYCDPLWLSGVFKPTCLVQPRHCFDTCCEVPGKTTHHQQQKTWVRHLDAKLGGTMKFSIRLLREGSIWQKATGKQSSGKKR